jgi:hypothetical protein
MKTRFSYLIHLTSILFAFGCDSGKAITKDCVKGQYTGNYCEGIVVKVLDDHKIGKSWNSLNGTVSYANSIVASVDSLLLKSLSNPTSYFSKDSIFYFQYREGGYPRKQYNVCEPASFLTISFVSKNPCTKNEN